MANYVIDKTVEFHFDAESDSDEHLRATLGVDSKLRVHPEHVLLQCKDGLRSSAQPDGMVLVYYPEVQFALMRAIDLSGMKESKVAILLRPPAMSKASQSPRGHPMHRGRSMPHTTVLC